MKITPSYLASELGKLARGKKKTKLTRKERKRRRELALANLAGIHARQKEKMSQAA